MSHLNNAIIVHLMFLLSTCKSFPYKKKRKRPVASLRITDPVKLDFFYYLIDFQSTAYTNPTNWILGTKNVYQACVVPHSAYLIDWGPRNMRN